MNKHTPGPWSVPHFARPDIDCQCEYVLCDQYMGAVCTVYASGEGKNWQAHGDNPKFDEACANARLIAAAPDLLAALMELVTRCDSAEGVRADGSNIQTYAAHAAIAKARGE